MSAVPERKLKMHYLHIKSPTEVVIQEEEREIYDKFVKAFEPTKADIERKISYDDQVKLCRHKNCCVLMSRWNPVDDYAQHFRKRGRLEGRTTAKINKLLARNVNKFKRSYSDETIQECRQREWMQRKKDNLLWLDLVKKQEMKELKLTSKEKSISDSSDYNDIFQKFCAVGTESMPLGSQSLRMNSQSQGDAPLRSHSRRMDLESQGDAPLFGSYIAYENFHATFTSTQKTQPDNV